MPWNELGGSSTLGAGASSATAFRAYWRSSGRVRLPADRGMSGKSIELDYWLTYAGRAGQPGGKGLGPVVPEWGSRRPGSRPGPAASSLSATRHVRAFLEHDGMHKYPGHDRYRAVDAHDGRNADDVMSRPNNRTPTRRYGWRSCRRVATRAATDNSFGPKAGLRCLTRPWGHVLSHASRSTTHWLVISLAAKGRWPEVRPARRSAAA